MTRISEQPGTTPSRVPAALESLLAETDPNSLRVSRAVLEAKGFAVAVVDSGIAAVVVAREEVPDLIVVGQQLRDVTGREAVRWLRSNPGIAATPIILLTSGEGEAGATLCRPASAASLSRTIGTLLDAAGGEA